MKKEKNDKKARNLQDLADLAGVSRATASRALNDSPLISEKTKSRLRDLASEHNYRVNRRARSFRLQRTGIISVVFMLDTQSEQHMSDPFFLEMLGSIADGLADNDYDLLLAHAPVRDILNLNDSSVLEQSDGVIFIGQGEQHDRLNLLARSGKPMVVWGGQIADREYVLVGADNEAGGYLATCHLLEQGRKRVAFFGNTRTPENSARYRGYKMALKEFDVDFDDALLVNIAPDMEHAKTSAAKAVRAIGGLDGVVCTSDVMAMATISALHDMNLSVPRDVAVVGYDDVRLASYFSPTLTTVRQNIRWAGKTLVDSVLAMIQGDSVPDTTLANKLIVRQSSTPEVRQSVAAKLAN